MHDPLVRSAIFTCSFSTWKVREDSKLWTSCSSLMQFIEEAINLCTPEEVQFCDGSEEEYQHLCERLVKKGTFIPLDSVKRPGSYLCRSDPSDVARVEECTFICSRLQEDAGPTNNWKDPEEMKVLLLKLFAGCMQGRTLYVVPFCMGSLGSSFSLVGVEITDSPYVVCSMHIMTRMGISALQHIQSNFIPCLHSVGKPLQPGEKDVLWPCNQEHRYIVHFPEERSIWSFGSGYGGNALLGKKSMALRIASVLAKEQGWLAEHMLLIGITNPEGKKKYFAGAFPSQCGKTNLALLCPSLPGWKVECVGDDIAWIRKGKDGCLYAVNPESGFFGVAPGTSYASNKYAMQTISHDTIFTNVALTQDHDVWWEGLTKTPPIGLIDWKGGAYHTGQPAAHPNARFTVKVEQCPILDTHFKDPEGIPLSGILFGGRRASMVPLVYEAFSWSHGVLIGACLSSETTSAAAGHVGKVRHDPFAMLPFCGYHMGDYFAHWLRMGHDSQTMPPIFCVNWFRKDGEGNFLWPGFGDNIRVLKWIFERTEERGPAVSSPIGYLPAPGSLDLTGLSIAEDELFALTLSEWQQEIRECREYFALFGEKMPKELLQELDHLEKRIYESSSTASK
ncbi:MAG: phosphoenolpyruvate carboxykinase (GTP) [Chlamydiae bacterium]|nr:phosphoenolpyruvate carboxykinase (GTP) [Chlamydiota bacterium]